MSTNEITGDALRTKETTDQFRDGYDLIWGKKKETSPPATSLAKEMFKKVHHVTYGRCEEFDTEEQLVEHITGVPKGYTAEELERDNPYNQWMNEDVSKS